MTATQTSTGRSGGEPLRPAGHHDAFVAAMNSGRPIVDNAGHLYVVGELEYDGPRCTCGTAVDNDGEMCDPCGDSPHEFIPSRVPGWCACGRIRSIGGYSPVHTDAAGGAA